MYKDIKTLTKYYLNKRDTLFLFIVNGLRVFQLPQLPPDIRRYIYRQICQDPEPNPIYFPSNNWSKPLSSIEDQRRIFKDMINDKVITLINNKYYYIIRSKFSKARKFKRFLDKQLLIKLFYSTDNVIDFYGRSNKIPPQWYLDKYIGDESYTSSITTNYSYSSSSSD